MGRTIQDEEILWQGVIRGDDACFSMLYNNYVDVLYAYGMRYQNNADLVKDCIHDLFIDIHTYSRTLAPQVNIKFYLMRSLRRKIATAIKKATASLNNASNYVLLHPDQFELAYSIEDTIITSESQRESMALLVQEMNQLPTRQKEILYLRFNAELDYEEIADIMNISVATCRTLVYRAVKQLRHKLNYCEARLMVLFMMIR